MTRSLTATTTFALAEARDRFSELVRRASLGETIAITLRGKDVARLVPITEPDAPVPSQSLVRRIRRTRAGSSLGHGISLRGLIEEGRR